MIPLPSKYWLGCSGYSYDDWVGNFYPPGLDKSLFFKFYSERFNTIEINSSFYQIPKRNTVLHWVKNAPSYFKFSFKLYREITHDRKLYNVKPVLDKFFSAIKALIDKNLVAVFLIQLPASFGKNLLKLENFFNELPPNYKYAIEFRHHSWLENDTFELLEKYNVAYTIVDEPHLPPLVKITTDFTYIRFHGHGKKIWYYYNYKEDELKKWAKQIKEIEPQVKEIYIYFNNHFRAFAPRNASQLAKLLGIEDKDLVPVQRQTTLWEF